MVQILVVSTDPSVPNWLSGGVVATSVALAVLAVALMLLRVRPPAHPDDGAEMEKYPTRYLDPVLVISALLVILLAAAAWLAG